MYHGKRADYADEFCSRRVGKRMASATPKRKLRIAGVRFFGSAPACAARQADARRIEPAIDGEHLAVDVARAGLHRNTIASAISCRSRTD